MGIACYTESYRQTKIGNNENGQILDFQKTVEVLRQITDLVNQIRSIVVDRNINLNSSL